MNTNYNISTEELASIDKYLLNELNAEERVAFENKMVTDPQWTAKVEEVKLLLTAIETTSLKEKLNSYHHNIQKDRAQTGSGKVISIQRKWTIAASVFLLVASSVWLYISSGNKYEKLYAAYYKPDPGLMSAMGINDNYLFNKAMLDYKTGEYKKAIAEWSQLKANMPASDTLDYFLGAAQQAVGNNTEAITLLKTMASDTSKPFYKDACWYTGLALLKQGNIKEAIPYLENSGRAESTELINKLK